MDERQRNIAVGLTSLIGVAGLGGLLLLFGYVPLWLETGYDVRIDMPNAAGLHEGSGVLLNGIDVGAVKSVRLQDPVSRGVVVVAVIDEAFQIPKTATVRVPTQLLGGSPALQFSAYETGSGASFLPTDGSAHVEGRSSSPFESLAGDVVSALDEPLNTIGRLSDNFEQLSHEWTAVGENLNRLLEQRSVDAVDGDATIGNLSTVVARADARLAEMKQVLAGINRYVNDPELHDDLRITAANARGLTDKLTASVDRLSNSLSNGVSALRSRYVALADAPSASSSRIRTCTTTSTTRPSGCKRHSTIFACWCRNGRSKACRSGSKSLCTILPQSDPLLSTFLVARCGYRCAVESCTAV